MSWEKIAARDGNVGFDLKGLDDGDCLAFQAYGWFGRQYPRLVVSIRRQGYITNEHASIGEPGVMVCVNRKGTRDEMWGESNIPPCLIPDLIELLKQSDEKLNHIC